MVGSVPFSSLPGARLIQEVYFNLTDDLTALEGVELVTLALNISGAAMTSLGQPATTVLNILDDDGEIYTLSSSR